MNKEREMLMSGIAIDLHGRTALVTGGAKGIGRTIAQRLADAGATPVVCGRSDADPDCPFDYVSCDVRNAQSVEAMMATIEERHGGLDILVNNAGGSPEADAATASPRFTEAIVGLNLLGPMHTARFAHRLLMRSSDGNIVNISSVSAIRPSPMTAAYSAAKAGLTGWTQSLAIEWGPHIRSNIVIVGYVETEQTEATYGDAEAQQRIAANIGAGRLARAQEIADAVTWLASPLASYVSGGSLRVDGGGESPPWRSMRDDTARRAG
ncbi:SDR family oxidoreductase [Croceicoccus sp. F390]|uniref:SDR family oxidoreductase n=1 Tax=Croceicoccus esteveae TaxID=3075597 RepID=A0ABU2ZFH2_9SPHN|nr:SDR family oxidoreductase [Croceicoccus sp. F390]MDT0575348.1 SDR family oxidoreductase [Croceicoccus sp. F390]